MGWDTILCQPRNTPTRHRACQPSYCAVVGEWNHGWSTSSCLRGARNRRIHSLQKVIFVLQESEPCEHNLCKVQPTINSSCSPRTWYARRYSCENEQINSEVAGGGHETHGIEKNKLEDREGRGAQGGGGLVMDATKHEKALADFWVCKAFTLFILYLCTVQQP